MKHSTDRILTTHCGSLARPKDLLDFLMKAKLNGESYNQVQFAKRITSTVAEIVRKQAERDIDVVAPPVASCGAWSKLLRKM